MTKTHKDGGIYNELLVFLVLFLSIFSLSLAKCAINENVLNSKHFASISLFFSFFFDLFLWHSFLVLFRFTLWSCVSVYASVRIFVSAFFFKTNLSRVIFSVLVERQPMKNRASIERELWTYLYWTTANKKKSLQNECKSSILTRWQTESVLPDYILPKDETKWIKMNKNQFMSNHYVEMVAYKRPNILQLCKNCSWFSPFCSNQTKNRKMKKKNRKKSHNSKTY